jgi:hypothetical protein
MCSGYKIICDSFRANPAFDNAQRIDLQLKTAISSSSPDKNIDPLFLRILI